MPSVLQLVRECKEVLKGGLLMKQYYQFMLHEVLDHPEKTDCNIDAFEEDLHKMLMVRAGPGGRGRCLTGVCLLLALPSSLLVLLLFLPALRVSSPPHPSIQDSLPSVSWQFSPRACISACLLWTPPVVPIVTV